MARIRTVKPEFWADEKLSPLAPIDRLVFLGLISMADDAGRLLDNEKVIDAFVFPNTSDSASPSVDRLAGLGRIRRGVTESGQRILQLVRWDHQKIDKPNLSSALPPIADASPTPPRHVADASPTHISTGTSTSVPPQGGWTGEAYRMWSASLGELNPGHLGRTLKPVVTRYGWEDPLEPPSVAVKKALACYIRDGPWQQRDGSIAGLADPASKNLQFVSPNNFVKSYRFWSDRARAA